MELWVRSQDKRRLVKVNSINILDNGLTFHGYINDKDHFWLGTYKTKERALEILDDIQKFISIDVNENGINYENADLILKGKIVENLSKIYTMPKE